ncbi:hypothetical protein L1887_28189 [Cichorium endivia]|nr:hypothetical protein L1887_28189 [Cichorium endivia]
MERKCPCGKGFLIRKISNSVANPRRPYYKCTTSEKASHGMTSVESLSRSSSGGKRSNDVVYSMAPRAVAALIEEFEGINLDGGKGKYDSDDDTHFDPFEDDPTDLEARWSP